MRLLPLLATIAFAGTLAAQTGNRFGIYPEQTNATSRSGLTGPADGDLMVKVDAKDYQFVGNWCSTSTIPAQVSRFTGTFFAIQDQDALNTPGEPMGLAIRTDDPNSPGLPDPTAAGLALDVALGGSPSNPAGATVQAWLVTAVLLTPAEFGAGSPPNITQSTFYQGIRLAANAAWTADGLSIHMASYCDLGGTFPTTHDNPRVGAPTLAHFVDRTNGTNGAGTDRTHNIHLLTSAPTLNSGQDINAIAAPGAINPQYGQGGVYPDSSGAGGCPNHQRQGNNDGAAFRCMDEVNNGGLAFLFLSSSFSPIGIPLTGFQGKIGINPAAVAQASFGDPIAPVTGNGNLNGQPGAIIAPAYLSQGALAPLLGSIAWQVVTVNGAFANGQFSNVSRIDFQ